MAARDRKRPPETTGQKNDCALSQQDSPNALRGGPEAPASPKQQKYVVAKSVEKTGGGWSLVLALERHQLLS
jgi:hypothetical protein